MSRRLDLCQFQRQLAKRLQEAASFPMETSYLGFKAAGQNWLAALSDIEEVVPVPEVTPVPRTKPWFRGLANIRGSLYAVSDLSAFLTGKPATSSEENRLILTHRKHGVNAALLVERVLGLKQGGLLEGHTVSNPWPWASQQILDSSEMHWNEINMARFLAEPEFLSVEA